MSKATRVLQLLSHVYYFRSVPPSSLVALMSLARELRFRAGDFIVHRGDSATHFFILESGKAEVWAEPLNDKEQTQQSTCVNAAGLVMVAMLGRYATFAAPVRITYCALSQWSLLRGGCAHYQFPHCHQKRTPRAPQPRVTIHRQTSSRRLTALSSR